MTTILSYTLGLCSLTEKRKDQYCKREKIGETGPIMKRIMESRSTSKNSNFGKEEGKQR